ETALVTPGIEGLFDSPVVKALGLYTFDMQRSIDHPTLDNIEARRHAVFNVAFRESPKVTLTANGTYDRTDTAGTLIFGTGLLLERQRAWRLGLGPSIAYQSSPLTTINAEYTWTNEGIEGTPAADEHVARAGIARRLSPRETVSVGYLGRHFIN